MGAGKAAALGALAAAVVGGRGHRGCGGSCGSSGCRLIHRTERRLERKDEAVELFAGLLQTGDGGLHLRHVTTLRLELGASLIDTDGSIGETGADLLHLGRDSVHILAHSAHILVDAGHAVFEHGQALRVNEVQRAAVDHGQNEQGGQHAQHRAADGGKKHGKGVLAGCLVLQLRGFGFPFDGFHFQRFILDTHRDSFSITSEHELDSVLFDGCRWNPPVTDGANVSGQQRRHPTYLAATYG